MTCSGSLVYKVFNRGSHIGNHNYFRAKSDKLNVFHNIFLIFWLGLPSYSKQKCHTNNGNIQNNTTFISIETDNT